MPLPTTYRATPAHRCGAIQEGHIMSASTIPTQAPATSAYAYDPATVVAAYQAGAVRLDVARRMAHQAMADAISDGDLAAAKIHVQIVSDLEAVSKATTSTARVITGADYAKATWSRVVMMRNSAYRLAIGDLVPTDVPSDLVTTYQAALKELVGNDWNASAVNDLDDTINRGGSEVNKSDAYAVTRVIGNASVSDHYEAIRQGRAFDRHGAAFTPEVGTVYTFAQIASLKTDAYPTAGLSNGAAAAAMTKRAEADRPAGWAYATMPAGSRATHGAKFLG